MARTSVWKERTFDAAHHLPNLPVTHPCARMHGHTYTVRVEVSGEVNPTLAWVMDLSAIRSIMDELVKQLDHRVLNEVDGLENPTCEAVAAWFWQRMALVLPLGVALASVEVQETPTSGARVTA